MRSSIDRQGRRKRKRRRKRNGQEVKASMSSKADKFDAESASNTTSYLIEIQRAAAISKGPLDTHNPYSSLSYVLNKGENFAGID
jgi:hypothetical protein